MGLAVSDCDLNNGIRRETDVTSSNAITWTMLTIGKFNISKSYLRITTVILISVLTSRTTNDDCNNAELYHE
jgi:hypothetical protein